MNSPRNAEQRPAPGDLVAGAYRLVRLVGAGGMALIYEAAHERSGERLALKLLMPELGSCADACARFLREARAAAKMRGRHLARVIDVGSWRGGLPFMVMEYLEGRDLDVVLADEGPLPPQRVVRLMLEACEALAEAHAEDIVHRDLKPANLFLARGRSGEERLVVLDFGISKAEHLVSPGDVITAGSMGSPPYISPEQLLDARAVDARSDIWALGITMHELLSGAPPFVGEPLTRLWRAILHEEPAWLQALVPAVPAGLAAVVQRCLAKRREDRFVDVGELAAALVPFSGGHIDSAARVGRVLAGQRSEPPPAVAPAPGRRSWPHEQRAGSMRPGRRSSAPPADAGALTETVRETAPSAVTPPRQLAAPATLSQPAPDTDTAAVRAPAAAAGAAVASQPSSARPPALCSLTPVVRATNASPPRSSRPGDASRRPILLAVVAGSGALAAWLLVSSWTRPRDEGSAVERAVAAAAMQSMAHAAQLPPAPAAGAPTMLGAATASAGAARGSAGNGLDATAPSVSPPAASAVAARTVDPAHARRPAHARTPARSDAAAKPPASSAPRAPPLPAGAPTPSPLSDEERLFGDRK